MNVDLLIAGLVSAMALWGALTGVAKQVASLVSVILAYLLARPIAALLGPHVAKAFHIGKSFGVAAATLGAFVLVVIFVRLLLTPLLRRMLAGKTPEDRSLDRLLGLIFGALKASLFAYVVICCLAFAEDNVSVAGRRLDLSPKGSVLFGLAHKYNLVTLTHFTPMEDLVTLANAATDPKKMDRLQRTPAYQALEKDGRFRGALGDSRTRKALEDGDAETALKGNPVLELIQDPKMVERLRAAAEEARSER